MNSRLLEGYLIAVVIQAGNISTEGRMCKYSLASRLSHRFSPVAIYIWNQVNVIKFSWIRKRKRYTRMKHMHAILTHHYKCMTGSLGPSYTQVTAVCTCMAAILIAGRLIVSV